jgi:predicted HAD superfamily Cof-like phosphohydrolase
LRGQQLTTEQRTIEFHTAFKHPVRSNPTTLSREEATLALALIEEEFWELAEALFPGCKEQYLNSHDADKVLSQEIAQYPAAYYYDPDLIEVADAVADLDVVVNGAGIRHGFDMQALSREVFSSNMSKLDADGKAIYHPSGKIAKSPLFREPDIAGALGLVAA